MAEQRSCKSLAPAFGAHLNARGKICPMPAFGSGLPHCNDDHPKTEPHTCPYQEEINDDRDFRCTCCERCTTWECADAL